jgi:hypothetical protein
MNHLSFTCTDQEMREMARRCFGYGCWEAPYWFIGPEQGQGKESLECRVRAWIDLGAEELCDCRTFHERIGVDEWHAQNPERQDTWIPLICLLMGFLEKPTDKKSLHDYQRDHWGSSTGETCVIELLGLPAKSLGTPRDRRSFRAERVDMIREKISVHRPKLVVMYGKGQKKYWNRIAGRDFPEENFIASQGRVLAHARHPVNGGPPDKWWEQFGDMLRRQLQSS